MSSSHDTYLELYYCGYYTAIIVFKCYPWKVPIVAMAIIKFTLIQDTELKLEIRYLLYFLEIFDSIIGSGLYFARENHYKLNNFFSNLQRNMHLLYKGINSIKIPMLL